MIEKLPTARKPAEFVGSALDDLSAFPEEVKIVMGFAIHLAQTGDKQSQREGAKGL
jgi:phage-related protein